MGRRPGRFLMKPTNDRLTRVAIYARVSSERQVQEDTIASQVQALRARVAEEGLTLDEELCFLDDGYSGSTLVRPALERLRDQAAAGAIERLYVHAPDRLARRYAYAGGAARFDVCVAEAQVVQSIFRWVACERL